MIFDLEKATAPDASAPYDVCIVGAGAAGISLAIELRSRGQSVLLLEGGGLNFEGRSQAVYNGETEGLPFKGLTEARFRALGGTTTQWGGQILEIDNHVFEERPGVPGCAWPFSKSELERYYPRAIELEGLTGSLTDADAVWQALGLSKIDFGDALISGFSQWCPNPDFSKLHGKTLRGDEDLAVYLHANVTEIMFANDSRTASHVACRTLRGKKSSFSAKSFVLCMGGIEVSRFLLQPPTQTHPAYWYGNKFIGKSFQDHISAFVATITECTLDPPDKYFDFQSVSGHRYHPKIKLKPEIQAKLSVLDICGTVASTTNGRDDLAVAFETYRLIRTRRYGQLGPRRLAHFAVNLPKLLWHKIPFARSVIGAGSHKRILRLCVHVEQSPFSESHIGLSNSRDELGLLRARLAWRASDLELHTIRTFVDLAQQAFTKNNLGNVVPDPGVMRDDLVLQAAYRESSHHMGGTRMAESVDQGVVDPNLKLFGADNVYVCSSSVFPSAGFANPTHTIIALAVRLAEHLSLGR